MTETPARRVYAIRLALGDGWKNALPMADFAALLGSDGDAAYDSAKVSRIESGERRLTLADVARIAAVDPQRRGKLWLAWGESADSTMTPVEIVPYPKPRPPGVKAHFAAQDKKKAARGGGQQKKGKSA